MNEFFYWQAFVAYLKSVMMASNKKIFNVTQIDLDDFARLVTLLLPLFYIEHVVSIEQYCGVCLWHAFVGLVLMVIC